MKSDSDSGSSRGGGGLAAVRRLEALGFRAWPAGTVVYDGSWQVRLTPGHPSKRLNSVNPLDPSDYSNIDARIARIRDRFAACGRPLIFRLTPLAARQLDAYFDDRGWSRFDESVVMLADVGGQTKQDGPGRLSMPDLDEFIDASMGVHGRDPALKPGLEGVLGSLQPGKGLFLVKTEEDQPVASALCVHDNDMAGLLELATRADSRRQGYGRRVVGDVLNWAGSRGASRIWLQVEAVNEAAIALYRTFGFRDVYRYHYREAPFGEYQ